jgi:hypothetical protein
MRTEEQFANAYKDAVRQVNMHNKPFWIVPIIDGYVLSCFEPKGDTLPEGTKALKVDVGEG